MGWRSGGSHAEVAGRAALSAALALALAGSCAAPRAGHSRAEASAPHAALDALLARRPARPLAGRLPAADGTGPFQFLVAGHLYGSPAPAKARDPRQAVTFREALDDLRAREPLAFVSAGDFVRAYVEPCLEHALANFERLDTAVLNAPGNHDIERTRAEYVERFGATFGGFRRGANLFLVLDTELVPWNLEGEQLAFLTEALRLAREAGIRNAFLFGHRVLFSAGRPRYRVLFQHCNSHAGWPGSSNFQSAVRPLLAEFARTGSVYWFAGDVGVPWSLQLFYDRDPEDGVHYLATGCGETPLDNVLAVHVDAADRVTLEPLALGGGELPALEACGPAWWSAHFTREREAGGH